MTAPMAPSVTPPPLAKARALGGVSSRSATAMRNTVASSTTAPLVSRKLREKAISGAAPAAPKASKSTGAPGRSVRVPCAAFQASARWRAPGPIASTAAIPPEVPVTARSPAQSPGRMPSAMEDGSVPETCIIESWLAAGKDTCGEDAGRPLTGREHRGRKSRRTR